MKKEAQIKETIKRWIAENKEQLPLNADSWKVSVFHEMELDEPIPVHLGKYHTALPYVNSFYKPYSKMYAF